MATKTKAGKFDWIENEEARKLRAEIVKTDKASDRAEERVRELRRQRNALTEQLGLVEGACTHQWTPAKPVEGTKEGVVRYSRACLACGKVQQTDNVALKWAGGG